MKYTKKRIVCFIVLISCVTVAKATCEDIKTRCYENFQLDLKACGADLSCHERALTQYQYCVKATGCPL